jgi:hypothetical protein
MQPLETVEDVLRSFWEVETSSFPGSTSPSVLINL